MVRKGTIWPGEFTEEELQRYAPLHEMHAFECGFIEWRARLAIAESLRRTPSPCWRTTSARNVPCGEH